MVIILLVIQIITESLPISSSTHVRLASALMKRFGHSVTVPRPWLWLVHGCTVFLMLFLMHTTWWPLVRHPWRSRNILKKLAVYGFYAELVTVLMYGIFHALDVEYISPIWGLLVTAGSLWSLRLIDDPTHGTFTFYGCGRKLCSWVLLGFIQGLTVIPGCSRLACTYVAARWLGYSGLHAWRMSCTLALPLFTAAAGVGCWGMLSDTTLRSLGTPTVVMILMSATAVAGGALFFVRQCMITGTVRRFAWYVGFFALLSLLLGV